MLTIFTIPKPFVGHIGVIQRNALGSWARLQPTPQVIVFGDEPGAAEAVAETGALHVRDVARNEFGTPLLDDAFAKARQLARYPLLGYVNADIILLDDILAAAQAVAGRKHRFMLAGQRWDLDVSEPARFDNGWQAQFRERARTGGVLHNITGMDYFVFTPDLAEDIPAMAVGRAMWDNWFLYHARARGAALVDVTPRVLAIHQNHDYSHLPGGKTTAYKGVEVERNKELAGGMDHYFTLRDATHQLTPTGLKRFTDRWHVRRWFLTLPVVRPTLGFPVRVALKTIEITHPIRAKLGMKLPESASRPNNTS